MSAHLVIVSNPFHPMQGRELREIVAGPPLACCAPQTDRPFILLRNGQAVLRRDWQMPIGDNDMIAVVYMPRGGGDGGSNPLKIVLLIAMQIVAPYVSAFIGTAFGTFGMAASTFMAVSNAAIGLSGTTLINADLGTSNIDAGNLSARHLLGDYKNEPA
jgi:hypothetical protein